MSREFSPLVNLPTELTVRILSFLLPDNVRALRHVIVACHRIDREGVCAVAERLLNEQRIWLSDRFDKNYEKTQARQTHSKYDHPRLMSIARDIVGKQYVEETEVVHESDNWTFKKSDMGIEKIRMTRNAYCYPDSHVEGPLDYDVDTPHHWAGSKCKGQPRRCDRLNIEVAFLPHPGHPVKLSIGVFGLNRTWQFFDGICIGTRWG